MILLALGVSVGPTIGGILTQALSWRWIFYVNLPIGALALLAAWRLLTERYHLEWQRFDLPGAALLATGLAALTLGLSFGQEWGWGSLRFLGSMGIAVAALAGAAWVERRVPAPVLDPALLRNRVFAFANVSFMICMLALFAVSFLLPFYLEELQGVRHPSVGAAAHAAPAGAGHRLRGLAAPERVDSSQLDRLPRSVPDRHRNRAGVLPIAQRARDHGSRAA